MPDPPALAPFQPFLECRLRPLTPAAFQRILLDHAEAGHKGRRPTWTVSYLNAHCSNLAARDTEYRRALMDCEILYADGQAVVWASALLGQPLPGRVNAGDFLEDFCREAARRKLSLGLLGGRPGLAESAARRWRERVPELHVAGAWPGYFEAGEEAALAEKIRRAAPDILLVGMGAPRQEFWARRWKTQLGLPLVWCVGALFEYWSGRARAPVWMRRAGLEWAFRLALEPRRLGRRYLIGNPLFVWRVLQARLQPRSHS